MFSKPDDVTVLKCLSQVMSEELDLLATHVLEVLDFGGGPLFGSKIISVLAEQEIAATRQPYVLFRTNSFTTKLAEVFLKKSGRFFLQTALAGPLEQLAKEKESFEIDPVKVTDATTRLQNITVLLRYVTLFWDSILAAVKYLPK